MPRLTSADLSDIGAVYAPFARSTPLWYYILAEAAAMAGGEHLGPVGGRIVTETLIGLLRTDPTSYLSVHPRFRPFLGADLKLGPTLNPGISGNRSYTRAHFLHYAGVVSPGVYDDRAAAHAEPRRDPPGTVPRSRPTSPARSERPRERGRVRRGGDRRDRVRRHPPLPWLLAGRPLTRPWWASGRAEWVWSPHPRGDCPRWRVGRSSSGPNWR